MVLACSGVDIVEVLASKSNRLLSLARVLLVFVLRVLSWFSRNGDTYAGEYFNDKMHGYGVYSFANGHRYEGAWHEGRKQGLGLYTFRNGETRAGYWNRGALETRSTQATDPQAPHMVHHSKVLHAVQVRPKASNSFPQSLLGSQYNADSFQLFCPLVPAHLVATLLLFGRTAAKR